MKGKYLSHPANPERRHRRRWKGVTAALSLVVTLVTTSALVLPAITLNEEQCGLQEHQHTERCYAPASDHVLICQPQIHQHTADCYDGAGNQTCGLSELVIHTHDDVCYDGDGELICSLPWVEEHTHDDSCYGMREADPGHTHGDGCYVWVKSEDLVCTLEENGEHTHSVDCYAQEKGELICLEEECAPVEAGLALLCGKEEVRAHTHGANCYMIELEWNEDTETEPESELTELETNAADSPEVSERRYLICTQQEILVHQHDKSCFGKGETILVCTLPEHTHDESCDIPRETLDDAGWSALTPDLTGQWAQDLIATARSQLGYRESATDRRNDAAGVSRGATLYGTALGDPYCPWQTAFVRWCLEQVGISGKFLPSDADVADWQTRLKDQSLLASGAPAPGDLVFLDLDGDENADVVGILAEPSANHTLEYWGESGGEATLCTLQGDFDGAVAQVAYEPGMLTNFVSVSDAQSRYDAWLLENPQEKGFRRSVQTEAVELTAAWGAEAGLPAGVTLTVQELAPESQEYQDHVRLLWDQETMNDLSVLQVLDVSFLDEESREVEPAASVDMRLLFREPVEDLGLTYVLYHFTQDGQVEELEAQMIREDRQILGVEYSQSAFSVIALAGYDTRTVDAVSSIDESGATASASSIVMSDGSESSTDRRTTDPVTLNTWTNFFPISGDISTERAGGIFTDKSVTSGTVTYTSDDGASGVIKAESGQFLVGLSTIASEQSIYGQVSAPVDVMFILDMSSSMFGGDSREPATVQAMVNALNATMDNILNHLNENNRVGVTIYWGGSEVTSQSTSAHCDVLLPLDHYDSVSAKYLVANVSNRKLVSIAVGSDVYNSSGKEVSESHSIKTGDSDNPYIAGTYAQAGILEAMDQFLRDDIKIELDDGTPRRPVFVFMTDGKVTAATENYTAANKKNANGTHQSATMGNNRESSRNSAESDFVTQLTAAYAKAQVDLKYYQTGNEDELQNSVGHALFYSLGLGNSGTLSLDVLNAGNVSVTGTPANKGLNTDSSVINISDKIRGYWNGLLDDGQVTFETGNIKGWSAPSNNTRVSHTVTTMPLSNGATFPSSIDQQKYVDRYYNAESSSNLRNAFDNIVIDISLEQGYIPTNAQITTVNSTGNVSFVDEIGDYMTVTRIYGIVESGRLYDGTVLARNFLTPDSNGKVDPNNKLGSIEEPQPLGTEFVHAVGSQLGIDTRNDQENYQKVMYMMDAAYNTGQLYYKSDDDYSNYIEWWAGTSEDDRKTHNFLGFCHDGDSGCEWYEVNGKCTCATPPEGAKYRIRSYFYLSSVRADESGAFDTNMMYANVWVQTDLETGDETVIYSLPASLVPVVHYEVGLGLEGNLVRLLVSGATSPATLVYQVGLKEGLDVAAMVDKAMADPESSDLYITKDENGEPMEVSFYSNRWENTNGYGTRNTYSYFRPNRENPRYYLTEDTVVYDETHQPYTGTGNAYRKLTWYTKAANGELKQVENYREIHDLMYDKLMQSSDGSYYIPAGTPHPLTEAEVETYSIHKTGNNTGTFAYSDYGYTDTNGGADSLLVGSILGNNGRLTVEAIDLSGTKTMEGVNLAGYTFEFQLYKATNTAEGEKISLVADPQPLQTVNNTGGEYNQIKFNSLWPAYPGTYYYLVREKLGDKTDYVIYDTREYWIQISVDKTTSVSIVQAGTDTSVTVDKLDFVNLFTARLPNTGGSGTLSYTISGWAVLALACPLLYSIKRKQRKGAR